ncbi:MAG: hypothetical protein U0792_19640 [Gemmataceae bacterium]
MTARVPLPFSVSASTRLLGEVIAWACPGLSVSHTALVAALEAADLDAGVARELAPRHAFARACRTLSERRIIRPVAEDANIITFQFTAESREDDRYDTLETMLTLDKQKGRFVAIAGSSRPLPRKNSIAASRFARESTSTGSCRNSSSGKPTCSRFDRRAETISLGLPFGVHRPDSGLPQSRRWAVHRDFPVPAGTTEGDRSVTQAVADGLAAVVAEHRAAVAQFKARIPARTH